MAKVKYATGLIPLLNKHFGFVFQPNHTNQTMKSDSSGARTRSVRQTQKQQGLMRAIRFWRTMSAATKNAWSVFASTYPQPSRRNPAVFLTGYQLFLKRNHYCFLNHGIDCDFLELPELTALDDPELTITINSSDNSIDVTMRYISNFGILPNADQYVLIRIIPMSENSGQFFETIEQTIKVDQVFIDGLFVSFNLSGLNTDLTFSVYLSKVFHQSTQYVGTKVRYMGCFTPKKFTALTDTPSGYAGQAGKFPKVKDTEDGLEFDDPGGGGISCEDLIDCPIIINILNSIDTLALIAAGDGVTSVPAVHFGLLYNTPALEDARKILSSDEWFFPSKTIWDAMITSIGGAAIAAGLMKDENLDYWIYHYTGSTNTTKFNARGAGRVSSGGLHAGQKSYSWIYSTTPIWGTYRVFYKFVYNSLAITNTGTSPQTGLSARPVKLATGIANGIFTTYTGNNGIVYRAVCINEYFWLADNLAETLYRDLSVVTLAESIADWASDLLAKCAAPQYDWNKV